MKDKEINIDNITEKCINNNSENFLNSEEYNNKFKELTEKKKKIQETIDLMNEKLYTKELNNNKNLLILKERLKKNITNIYKFYLDKYIISIISILDSVESSILSLNKNNEDTEIFFKKLNEIKFIFDFIFKKYNVNVIDKVNVPFDPSIHQAISIDVSGKIKKNYIYKVIQKGYSLNLRLLRPAIVIVSQK